MAVDFSTAFEAVRPAVVGLGFVTKGGFDTSGTGFIVSEQGWILTNRQCLAARRPGLRQGCPN
ncbi:MAG TPA: hypothetical protein VKC51_12380 [Lacunisphaera sp.]|nr:hypothetical protein [Lacunisphaera sp.]